MLGGVRCGSSGGGCGGGRSSSRSSIVVVVAVVVEVRGRQLDAVQVDRGPSTCVGNEGVREG